MLGFLVAFLIFLLSGFNVVSERFSRKNVEIHFAGKWAMTYAGIEMFKKSPLIGLGYKGYYDNFGKYFYGGSDKYDAHNIFITALTNYGLLGFIPFLCIFLYPLFVARKALKMKNSILKDLAVVCISSTIPFMASGWFAGNLFYNPVLVIILYTNISLLLSSDIYRK